MTKILNISIAYNEDHKRYEIISRVGTEGKPSVGTYITEKAMNDSKYLKELLAMLFQQWQHKLKND